MTLLLLYVDMDHLDSEQIQTQQTLLTRTSTPVAKKEKQFHVVVHVARLLMEKTLPLFLKQLLHTEMGLPVKAAKLHHNVTMGNLVLV